MNNTNKLFLTLFILATPYMTFSCDGCKIVRITADSLADSLVKEKVDAQYRYVQKCATVGAAIAATVGLLKFQNHFIETGQILKPGEKIDPNYNLDKANNNNLLEVSQISSTPLSWSFSNMPSLLIQGVKESLYSFGQNVKSKSYDLTKWIAIAAPAFAGSLILNSASSSLQKYWAYFNEVEELDGFIKYKTKLWKVALVVKEFTIPFDIYSERLSVDMNIGQQRVMLASFMKDMLDAVDSSSNNPANEWMKDRMLMNMKKDYLDKTSSLHELEGFAIDAMNFRKRIESGLVSNVLAIEERNRRSIAEFSNFLILEIEKIVAFVNSKIENDYNYNYIIHRTQDLVVSTNLFAEQVEIKLALPMDILYEQSKNGDGLFDLVFDFISLLEQQFKAINLRLLK